jgi:hypothetical protein
MRKVRLESEGKTATRYETTSANLFQAALSVPMPGRRAFFTQNKYLGIGPPLIEKGDMVCIFYGACTPFIIRKRPHHGYFLVGEFYVHGLMGVLEVTAHAI